MMSSETSSTNAIEEKFAHLDPTNYKLTNEEKFPLIKGHMVLMHKQTEWNNAETLKVLKELSGMYTKNRSYRKGICALLIDLEVAGLFMKMLNYFDSIGVFTDDATWFPTYYIYLICWNFTDASTELGKELANAGMLKTLAANITHQPYLENQGSKNVLYIIKASLSIILNLTLVPNITDIFEECKVKELLQPFLTSTNEMFKALATMALTSLINEDENKMMEDTGAIKFIVKGLESALKKKTLRRYRGFSTSEMTNCLSRMAANDANKQKIVSEGALPLFVKMLKSEFEPEHEAAGRVIWNISFDKSLTQTIREEEHLMSSLQERSQSTSKLVAKYASGALWVLDDKAETREKEVAAAASAASEEEGADTEVNMDYIFVSYSWADQKSVIEIKDHLKMNGFRVWFDLEQMGGSTLEAMASGIENASLVLVCVSEKYKVSPNCRTEAEYTFQLKKPIVPVMMQRRYKADGWLGMLLGSKFYVNFDGKYPFAQAFEMLIKELNGRGKEKTNSQEQGIVETPIVKPEAGKQLVEAAPPVAAAAVPEPRHARSYDWNKDRIQEWREKYGLTDSRYDMLLGEINGGQLAQMVLMKDKAPEFLYRHLSEKLGLELLEILTLSNALSHC